MTIIDMRLVAHFIQSWLT